MKKRPIIHALTKPVLRLEDEASFDRVPRKLRNVLIEQLGVSSWNRDQFEIKIIGDDERYLPHYQQRIQAINDGVEFLLDSLPLNHPFKHQVELKKYLNKIAQQCMQKLLKLARDQESRISDYQNSLANYVDYVLEVLQSELGLSKEQAIHQLGRAEEFALAKKTKPTICTLARAGKTDDEYIVNIDQPENPFNEKLKKELEQIKNKVEEENLPEWFQVLSEDDKNFIRKFLDDINLDTDLGRVVNALSSKLRIIPAPANYATHTLITHIKSKVIVHASEIRSSHAASRDVAKQKQRIRDIHANRNLSMMVDDAVSKKKSQMEKTSAAVRKSGATKKIARERTRSTPKRKTITVPILYQTLITPFKAPDSYLEADKSRAVARMRRKLSRQYEDGEDTVGRVQINFVVISTNHPLNYGKYISPTTASSATGRAANQLIESAHQFQIEDKNKNLFKDAAEKLRLYTNSSARFFLNSYRELYLSSLEQIVTSAAGGISIGSCVSGKDRKALEISHTSAMRVFHTMYGRLPPFEAKTKSDARDMRKFSDMFARIYCTKHQHAVANLNAPGSFGLKTPEMYLPGHLKNGIKQWYKAHEESGANYRGLSRRNTLMDSDRLATNNEIGNIKHIRAHAVTRLLSRITKNTIKDRAWKKPNIHLDRIYSVKETKVDEHIVMISAGLENYLQHCHLQHEKLNTHSHFLMSINRLSIPGVKKEIYKTEAYQELLGNESPLNIFQKSIITCAMFTNNKDTKLQTGVFQAMGFTNVKSAHKVFADYLIKSAEDKNEVDKMVGDIIKAMNTIDQANKTETVGNLTGLLAKYSARTEALSVEQYQRLAVLG